MASSLVLTLPNGIQQSDGTWTKEVEIEEMTGSEEDILVDQTRATGGTGVMKRSGSQRITEILSRCTARIGSERRPDGKDRWNAPLFFERSWQRSFSGDRIFSMIRVRQMSLGSEYAFPKSCPSCKKEIKRCVVQLDDIEVTPIELAVASKKAHACALPRSKDIVHWVFIRGEDEDIIADLMTSHLSDFLSAAIYKRIAGVQKFDPQTGMNGPVEAAEGGLLYVKKMSMVDRRALANAFDTTEGGIDTSIQITCDNPSCRMEFSSKLDIMGGDFFFPSEIPSRTISTSALSPNGGDTALQNSTASLSHAEGA